MRKLPNGHGHLPFEAARHPATQLPAHAGAQVAAPVAQPRPGQVRTPDALLRFPMFTDDHQTKDFHSPRPQMSEN